MKRGFKTGSIVLMLIILSSIVIAASVNHISLREPSTLYVEKGDVVSFSYENKEYDLVITDIYVYSIDFLISGKLVDFPLREDSSVDINLDDFGEPDIKISAETIVANKRGTLTIERLVKGVPVIEAPAFKPVNQTRHAEVVEEIVEEEVVEEVVEEEVEEEIVPVEEKPKRDYTTVLYILVAVVACFVVLWSITYFSLSKYSEKGVSPKLIRYAKKAQEQNIPSKEMRTDMKTAGWTDEEIDLAIRTVQGKTLPVA